MLRSALLFALAAIAAPYALAPGSARARAVDRAPHVQMAAPPVAVMMNGLPGAMGVEIAQACLRRAGVTLAPFALTGPETGGEIMVDGVHVELYTPDRREELAARALAAYPVPGSLVCVDFTHPSAVNGNAEWYGAHGFPFVMGTTGGDRAALVRCTEAAGTYAVIAPNMAKQIVALQAALERMADEFPGSFSGYTLSVDESHQSTKADTSGTAKAISDSLATLTAEADWSYDSIGRVRDVRQQALGGGPSHRGVSPVPEAALQGHAFHTYSMLSADGQVEFQVRHNVCGRSTYAEGTVDACIFLAARAADDDPKRLFDMVDVLKAGAM